MWRLYCFYILFLVVLPVQAGQIIFFQGDQKAQTIIGRTVRTLRLIAQNPDQALTPNFNPLPDIIELRSLQREGMSLRPLIPPGSAAYFAMTNWSAKSTLLVALNELVSRKSLNLFDMTHLDELGENLHSDDLVRMNIDFLLKAPDYELFQLGHIPLASLTSVSFTNRDLAKTYPDLLTAIRRARHHIEEDVVDFQSLLIQFHQGVFDEIDLNWLVDQIRQHLRDPNRRYFWDSQLILRYSMVDEDYMLRSYFALAGWMTSRLDSKHSAKALVELLMENKDGVIDCYERSMALLLAGHYSTSALIDYLRFKFERNRPSKVRELRFFAPPPAVIEISEFVWPVLEEKIRTSLSLREEVQQSIVHVSRMIQKSRTSLKSPQFEMTGMIQFGQMALTHLHRLLAKAPPSAPPVVIDFEKQKIVMDCAIFLSLWN